MCAHIVSMAEFDINDITSRVDIVELVTSYGVALRRSGSEYKGICPFHNEKTASFMVDPAKGFYHCFGCQKSGTVITFVMEKDGLTYWEAVQKLADRCGIRVPSSDNVGRYANARRYNFLEKIAEYFNQCLRHCKETDAPKVYLVNRGLSSQAIDIFKLGYVPLDCNVLIKWAEKHGFGSADLKDAGIVLPPDKEHLYCYNRFGGRIVFPLFDKIGRVVGFSGRIIANDNKAPKYINSPDSAIFRKRNILFGLNLAAPEIVKSEEKRVIICEGPIDVIRCYVNGFRAVVASQGTSFTTEHVELVKNIANNVTIAFDGDAAGIRSAIKAGELFLSAGVYVNIAQLPPGQDPDSLIRDCGSNTFSECLRDALPLITFLAKQLLDSEEERASVQVKLNAAKELLMTISKCRSAVMQEVLLEEASKCLNVSVSALKSDMEKSNGSLHAICSDRGSINKLFSNNRRQAAELLLLRCLLQCHSSELIDVESCLRKAYRDDLIGLDCVREFVRVWMSKRGKLTELEKGIARNRHDDYLHKFGSSTDNVVFKIDDEISCVSEVQEILRHLWMEYIRDARQKDCSTTESRDYLSSLIACESAVLSGSWEDMCGLIADVEKEDSKT